MSEETLHRRRFTLDSLDGIVFDLDENDKSYEVLDGLKFNPNQPRVASGPQGGQWTAGSWSAAVTAAPKELHDAAGNPIPGNVGKLSKIDTSKWKITTPAAKVNLKKIALFEELAKNKEWGKLAEAKNKIPPSVKPNTYQKAAIQSLSTLLEASKLKSVNEIPEKAEVTKEDTAVLSTKGWTQITGKLGTEEGGKFKGPDGKEYYVKTPTNPARAHNEVLASKLYEAFGAQAIKSHLVNLNGKTAVASEWAQESVVPKWDNPHVKVEAARDFAVHALLGNWDVIGHPSQPDNCKYIDGKLTLVDAGGSLEFKASGGSGKKPFGPNLNDYDTLRNPSYNTMGAKVFGGMTQQQHIESMGRVVSSGMTPKKIQDLVDKYHGGTEAEKQALGKTLATRLELMKEKYNKALEAEKETSKKAVEAASHPEKKIEPPASKPPIADISLPAKPANLASLNPHIQTLVGVVEKAALAPGATPDSVIEKYTKGYNKLQKEEGDGHYIIDLDEHPPLTKYLMDTCAALKAKASAAGATNAHGETSQAQQKVAESQPATVAKSKAKAVNVKPFLKPEQQDKFLTTLKDMAQKYNDSANTQKIQNDFFIEQSKKELTCKFIMDAIVAGNFAKLKKMKKDLSVDSLAWGKIDIDPNSDVYASLTSVVNKLKQNVAEQKTLEEGSAVGGGKSYKSTSASVGETCWKLSNKIGDSDIVGKVGFWNVLTLKSDVEPSKLDALAASGEFYNFHQVKTVLSPLESQIAKKSFAGRQDVKDYTGGDYRPINKALRTGEGKENDQKKALSAANAVMKNSIDLPVGLKLSRKYDGKVPKVGTVVADRGILSTSYNKDVWHGDVHMELTVGPGVKGLPIKAISNVQTEQEIVLPPNTKLYISKVSTVTNSWGGPYKKVIATILPFEENQCCPP